MDPGRCKKALTGPGRIQKRAARTRAAPLFSAEDVADVLHHVSDGAAHPRRFAHRGIAAALRHAKHRDGGAGGDADGHSGRKAFHHIKTPPCMDSMPDTRGCYAI